MKKLNRKLGIIPGVIVISLMVVSTVLAAGYIGSVDGVWEWVEDGANEAALCDGWATGNGDNITAYSGTKPLPVQDNVIGDENQIRYGDPANDNCPGGDDWEAEYDQQSGFGFDGVNEVGVLGANTPFLLGRASHYNHPITLGDVGDHLDFIDIDVTLSGILCPGNYAPLEGSTREYTFRVSFDETPNSANPCAYPLGPNQNGCSDRIIVSTISSQTSNMTCTLEATPASERGIYTLQVLGLMSDTDQDGDCTDTAFNSAAINTTYYTAEDAVNHACMFGIITGFEPTVVQIKSFTAVPAADGVSLTWATISESNTFGFNLFRAETYNGTKVQINSSMIPSKVAPGTNMGAVYTYVDTTAVAGVTYYYWLEEVELDGATNLHGPVTVVTE